MTSTKNPCVESWLHDFDHVYLDLDPRIPWNRFPPELTEQVLRQAVITQGLAAEPIDATQLQAFPGGEAARKTLFSKNGAP